MTFPLFLLILIRAERNLSNVSVKTVISEASDIFEYLTASVGQLAANVVSSVYKRG